MLKVLHIITDLDGGGAETVLARLITADRVNTHHVVSLMDAGTIGPVLRAAGIAVHTLELAQGKLTRTAVLRLARLVRDLDPSVIQTWMYHADFLGGIVARLCSRRPVLWGLHNAYLDPEATRLRTRLIVRTCAALSHVVPSLIISCSEVGARLHVARGYAQRKIRVIPNGYDSTYFIPDAEARVHTRAEWGISDDAVLFGMVARWDPQKDHANLIRALTQLQQQLVVPWYCALVGTGMRRDNHVVMRLLDEAGIRDRVLLCGPRTDMVRVMNALDIHVLSSMGESFPNVVAEAMSCGTPCVATDVGDAARIVGDTGWIVPPRNSPALASALLSAATELISNGLRSARQEAARQRIVCHFSIERMLDGYQQAWQYGQKHLLTPVPQVNF